MFMGASTKQGYDIATKSREIIRELIGDDIKDLKPAEKDIVERIVHSTADPEYAKLVAISDDFVDAALKSMKNNETILTDINMVKAGITQYDGEVCCYIKNDEVKQIAKENEITRAAAAIRYACQNDFEGIIVQDNPDSEIYPIATNANGHDEVFVGRIRRDYSIENGLNIWVVADNLRKGAATNAVQILKCILEKKIMEAKNEKN